jgi:hypothetical protein
VTSPAHSHPHPPTHGTNTRALPLALALLALVTFACTSQAPLENRPCGCAPEWTCCPARGICVRPGELDGCFPDASAPDASAPDAPALAADATPDASAPGVTFSLPAEQSRVQGLARIAVVADLPLAKLELWVDDQLRVTAPGTATFLDWPAFRETLGAHPRAIHRLRAVAVGQDGRRYTQETHVFTVASPWGDCDSDGRLSASDLAGVRAETTDGDATSPESTPGGAYAGSPACDVNDDNAVDSLDRDCLDARLSGAPDTCVPPDAPAVRTVIFLPFEDHPRANDSEFRELVRNKLEEARRFIARHNGGRTFRALDVEVFMAPQGRGFYRLGSVINYENVLNDLGLPGYVEPSNKALTPWNQALWVFVAGGSDSVVVDRFANGHGYALVSDAYLRAARDLDCSDVAPSNATDPVNDTCLQVWLKSGQIYGQTMGRAVQALARALGAVPLATGSPDWSTSIMGNYERYPAVGLGDGERTWFGGSHFFPGSDDPLGAEITLISPAPGATVWQPFIIQATARDNYGVRSLSILVDDTVLTNDEISPVDGDFGIAKIEVRWDPGTVTPGLHTIRVRAVDTAGNTESTNINVTVTR